MTIYGVACCMHNDVNACLIERDEARTSLIMTNDLDCLGNDCYSTPSQVVKTLSGPDRVIDLAGKMHFLQPRLHIYLREVAENKLSNY